MSPVQTAFLERGKACVDCRRRKVRCDGAVPACGRCVRAGHEEDCEYMNEYGQTRSQMLEESIAKLESRLKELERSGVPVLLHQAYASSPQAPSPSRGSLPPSPVNPTTPNALPLGLLESTSPPPQIAKTLINFFAPHASQFGFFLNGPRFVKSVFQSDPRIRRPSQALLSVVYLFGVHLSSSDSLHAQESKFLARANHELLMLNHSEDIIQRIQSEVLMAHYFLRNGKFLEAMHRINRSVSLCIGSGLHKVHSGGGAVQLSPVQDSVERGERIDALWTVLSLHKCWAIALQWPTTVSDVLDEQVDIPWSYDMALYEAGKVPPIPRSKSTLKAFLDNPAANVTTNSSLALRVQATTLLERSRYLGIQWRSDLNDPDEHAHFRNFEQSLSRFLQCIPSLENLWNMPMDVIRTHLVTFTISHVSMIQLHMRMQAESLSSQRRVLEAAQTIVAALNRIPNLADWKYINPIMGTMMVVVCEVFIENAKQAKISNDRTRVHHLISSLREVMNVMGTFSAHCSLFRLQLKTVQDTFSNANIP